MSFLIDHKLSPRLVDHLGDRYPGTVHTRDLGFERIPDMEVWRHAAAQGHHILTKDTDFEQLSMLHGAPPKVVWLRVGNASTQAVITLLDRHQQEIADLLEDEERSLLALSY